MIKGNPSFALNKRRGFPIIGIISVIFIILFIWNLFVLIDGICKNEAIKITDPSVDYHNINKLTRNVKLIQDEYNELQEKHTLQIIPKVNNLHNKIITLNEDVKLKANEILQLQQQLDQYKQSSTTSSDNVQHSPNLAPSIALNNPSVIPILVICHARPNYLRKTLNSLIKHRAEEDRHIFPIIVSQDGTDSEVWNTILENEFADDVVAIQYQKRKPLPSNIIQSFRSYYYIAQHFQFALSSIFDKMGYQSTIIVEEDLIIATDFYEYFRAMLPLLQNPAEDLFCVSAWNDNGKPPLAKDSSALRRSDFFPGLGWMITKQFWDEIKSNWPAGFWDDWLREPEQRKNRHCIYPEISRTHTIGAKGSSGGIFYHEHLKHIILNEDFQPFRKMDLSYLSKNKWRADFRRKLMDAKSGNIIPYKTMDEFKLIAERFSIMKDEKAGVQRGSYEHVVWFWRQEELVFIVPHDYKSTFDIN